MIIDLLILTTIGLLIAVGWFDLFSLSLWIVVAPVALAYALRILLMVYARLSQERWEEYRQALTTEREGIAEFRDVMVQVIIQLLTPKKKKKEKPEISSEIPAYPFTEETEQPKRSDVSEELTR